MAEVTKELNLSLTTPLGEDSLKIQKIHGEERISSLYRYTLAMTSTDNSLDFDSIVGENVTVSMSYGDGQTRYFNGVVGRFVQSGSDQWFTTYYAEIYPWFWLLTFYKDSRIFQNKSVPDIITELCSELGFTDYRDDTTGTYTAREYCVQYQETTFDFLSRLMEEEGIFYFFEHTDGVNTLVLGDDASNHAALTGLATARLGRSDSPIQEEDIILHCTLEKRVTTGKYAVDDFNFETPSTDLITTSDGTNSYRVYEYPGGFTTSSEGEGIADKRLQAQEQPAKMLRGDSLCRAFTAGYKFDIDEHDRTDINSTYIIQQLSVNASQDGYRNSFLAFPSTVPFRPARTTPKPRVYGTQSAIVVGASGEEIYTDEYGRIKVQFHWDQEGQNDENSSCWIRVAHGWAGKAWGQIFIPRIGQEVLVSYLNGDPDCPIVTGCVYNAEQTVPYTLPDDKTKSTIKTRSSKTGDTATFNEIRFQDLKGSEEFYVHAEKDMNRMIENNRTTTIGDPDTAEDGSDTMTIKNNRTTTIQEGDETLTVEQGNRVETISQGNETLTVTEGNRTVEVTAGNETYTVGGTRDSTVTGNETRTNEADYTQDVTGNFTLNVSGNLTIDVSGTVTIKSGGAMTIESGSTIDITATGDLTAEGNNVTNKAGMNLTNEAGMNLENTGLNVKNNASAKLENIASGMQDVKAGGILTVAGSMINIG